MQRFAVGLLVTATASLTCIACGGGTPPSLEPQSLPSATLGQYYEVAFTASDGATVTSPNLPSNGLKLVTSSGHALLFGVPASAGTMTVHATAIVGGPTMFQTPPSTERDYSLVVGPRAAQDGLLLHDRSYSFNAGTFATAQLSENVVGGVAPYRFDIYCLDRGEVCPDPQPTDAPPQGIILASDGTLSGTVGPQTGTYADPNHRRYDFIVCVTDASSAHACGTIDFVESAPASPAAT